MTAEAIFGPVLAMFVLTFLVWVRLYVERVGYLRRERIRPDKLGTPREAARVIPDDVNLAAYNLNNLSELPIVFYALAAVLYLTGLVDMTFLGLAWAYFVLRAAHSLVHCTFNDVMLRFSLYLLSSLVLWFMVFRTIFLFLAGTK